MEREIGAPGRGPTNSGTEERRALPLVKAESNKGDQVRDFPRPFEVATERSKNPSRILEKLPVEVKHTHEPLESRLV